MTEGLLKWQGCLHLKHQITGSYIHAEKNTVKPSEKLHKQDAFIVEKVRALQFNSLHNLMFNC
jgi:hypothetical protein